MKVLISTQQRLLLVDAEDVIFASIDGGMITVVARELEGSSNYRTLEEMEEALASDVFWRPHRSFLVNIHHIKEVIPWFKSTYMLKMDDKKHTQVPVSRSQTKRLRELFKVLGEIRFDLPSISYQRRLCGLYPQSLCRGLLGSSGPSMHGIALRYS